MDLMIDIGNTHTVVGLFGEDKLKHNWRLSSTLLRTEDEIWAVLTSFFKNIDFQYQNITGIAISSVVPNLTLIYDRMVDKYLGITPLYINAQLDLGMDILYENPNAVGADRICNAVAGKEKYGFPLIILDFGTATTFDCIDSNGNYIGGVICPGIESAASILHHKAAKLPKIDLEFPEKIIGTNTDESMQSGIMYGFIELINGLLEKISVEMGDQPRVIATGGFASLISTKTDRIEEIDLELNLVGIHNIYKRNLA
ncbi:MAG: type III pantothenate kinase [Calditrichia bacterium]|nr:type III pantothenate kinase [Calditrichia bacterium]